MKRETEFLQEIRNRLWSVCSRTPGRSIVDPVLFVAEWQNGDGIGGYMAQLTERVLGWKGHREASQIADEVVRLALKEAAEGEEILPVALEAMLRYQWMVHPLVDWFHDNARILRWRSEPTPYYVWVSEIMLQQTRVEAVKGYFDRFVDTLPDIRALAECPEDKLLKLWEGLGYYSRVRNLQKAAIRVVEEYDGKLPASYEELQKLPGIGSYTAGAVASIAYGKPAPAVDGNVLRVAKRLMLSYDDVTKATVKKELEQMIAAVSAEAQIQGVYPGDLNQALMELGAVVCLPVGKPLCDRCPLDTLCRMNRQDLKEELWRQIPVKPAGKSRRVEERTIFLLQQTDDSGQEYFALNRREEKGLLAGLWELPGVSGQLSAKEAREMLRELRIDVQKLQSMGEAKHIFSHVEWRMRGYAVRIGTWQEEKTRGSQSELWQQLIWITKKELEESYSLPSAFDAYRPM